MSFPRRSSNTSSWARPGRILRRPEQAKHSQAQLKKPDAAAFYKELYAYSPPKVTLPAMGNEKLDFPGRSRTSPGLNDSPPRIPGPVELTPPDISEIRPAPGGALARERVHPLEKKAESKTPRK